VRLAPRPMAGLVLVWVLFVVFLLIGPQVAPCQPIGRLDIPSSFNPVGSGARALGMGGAFIAIADDATAASWNPAGLLQLERPEISAVGSYFRRSEDLIFGTNPEGNGSEGVSQFDLNYLSATLPFHTSVWNMVVSINYQNLFDFRRKWSFDLNRSSDGLNLGDAVDLDQDGNLYALGVAYAFLLPYDLRFGLTSNFWNDDWFEDNWNQNVTWKASGTQSGNPFYFESTSREGFSFKGFNANVGVQWDVTGRLTVGAVLKTPFTAHVERKTRSMSSIHHPSDPHLDETTSNATKDPLDLKMPMSYGIGLAYRFTDAFTVSADAYRTEWDDFKLEDSEGNKISPISGKSSATSDVDPTHQIRLGAEYLFFDKRERTPIIAFRLGAFYDPAPAEGSQDKYYGFSFGTGLSTERCSFDIAYQYRFGRDVGGSILQDFDFSEDVDEHTVLSSLIIYF
jgi:long-subunit fatty acid transport protein